MKLINNYSLADKDHSVSSLRSEEQNKQRGILKKVLPLGKGDSSDSATKDYVVLGSNAPKTVPTAANGRPAMSNAPNNQPASSGIYFILQYSLIWQ